MSVAMLRTRLAVAALAVMLVYLDAPPSHLGAQTDQGTMFAPIMRTERAGGGIVRVVYDLRGVSGTAFAVSLEASDDGGQTYTIRPRALTGDVGARVSPGAEKTIVWDSTKDVDDLQVDRYVFRVRVTATGPNTAVPPRPEPPGGTTPAVGRGAAPSPAGATATAKKGGLGKGAIFGIVGGAGAAAGVGIALANGGNGTSTPSSTGTPPRSSPTITTLPLGAGIRDVTMFTFAANGGGLTSPTFTWDFGDGSTASGPTVTHVYAAEGTFSVTVQASAGTDRVTTATTVTVGSVTGTWRTAPLGDITFSLVLAQQGNAVTGTYRMDYSATCPRTTCPLGPNSTELWPMSATLADPRRIVVNQLAQCQRTFTAEIATDLRSISGTVVNGVASCGTGQSTVTYVRQ